MVEQVTSSIPIGKKIDERDNIWANPHTFEELPEEVRRYLADRRNKTGDKRTTLQRLEGKHVLSLIVYLNSMSPVTKSDIYNDVARHANMVAKLKELEDMELIQIYCSGRTNTNIVIITQKGREVAERISRMVDIIDGREEMI
ncbi:hypothetical protein PED39_04605 [Methanomassiliicoccales archaeon LGM-RCC1]|nr:hypothetical protein PED39_04605 [Methanomassiliicoccales archaeon LGM-RCC1]